MYKDYTAGMVIGWSILKHYRPGELTLVRLFYFKCWLRPAIPNVFFHGFLKMHKPVANVVNLFFILINELAE